ncbi:MAG TPA: glutamyl-tRNA reductase [Acidimicrobiales bacterium]|nr:glutamyl-tRNA reductase [Acidimicrobiales bacterium]
MSIVVVGLDQQRTPLGLLERVAVGEQALSKTLADLRDRVPVSEVVVLSTCLRTEVYAVVDRFHEGVERIHEYLADCAGAAVTDLSDHLNVLFDDAVAVHLFEVAAGLRSAVVGETEVLGQVRRALEVSEKERAAGPVLSGLFRRAVQAGRKVRSDTAISQGTTSLAHVALSLAAERVGGSLDGHRVVVVGAGDMGRSLVTALDARHRPEDVVVVNRTPERARDLSEAVGRRAVEFGELAAALSGADVLLVASGSSVPVVDGELLSPLAAARLADGLQKLVVVDLSVPRNVEPSVRVLAGVALFDMDDLSAHAERVLDDRRQELAAARVILSEEIERYRSDDRARGAAPVVTALRSRLEELRRGELARHRRRMPGLDDQQWSEVEAVVGDVLAKLVHRPIVTLKEAAGTPRGERLVEALRALFDL